MLELFQYDQPVQAQFNAFTGQARDLSEAYAKTATDALETRFKKVA
jgi:hypothetical protein